MTESFAAALLKMGFWLAVLLGLLFALAWAVKKLGLAGFARGSEADAVRIVSRTAIDPRKSILVANVRDRLLVLGVTPSEVRLLTELASAAPSEAAAASLIGAGRPAALGASSEPETFASRLGRVLRGTRSSRPAH